MKTQRTEWRKELRQIATRRRAIYREDRRDEAAMQREIVAAHKAFNKLLHGRSRELITLTKRVQILQGRLAS